ncbi:hypothetical protein SPBRAN_1683 [uncultured Candidatus Thioglobus sp.]|nr:hypothetical protein SPBRAN_1683 [uncultured Candidatus Thioglobus sp.]
MAGVWEAALGDFCINRNNQQNTTFYQLGSLLKPTETLLELVLIKYPSWQNLSFY